MCLQGKFCEPAPERQLKEKLHRLFSEVSRKIPLDDDEEPYTFEDFARQLDERDKKTRQLFELMIKVRPPLAENGRRFT